jgi:predicted  nucleic acid-binding Zn-ribbon protein
VETEALEKRLNVLEARTAALEKNLAEERAGREARPRKAEERLSNLELDLERERTERSTAQLRLSKATRLRETEEWDRRVNELETRAGDLERQLVHERDERLQATRKAMRSIQTVAELAGKR